MTSPIFAIVLALAATQGPPPQIQLRFDYSGAEAMLEILERDSLNDAAVDSLLAIRPVRDMVRNTIAFSPAMTVEHFRSHIKSFVRTKTTTPVEDRSWQLRHVWNNRGQLRALLEQLKANEDKVVRETVANLGMYAPRTGPLEIVVYFIAGGNSGGGPIGTTGLYANLVQANGDFHGVISNLAHESYHVMQNEAWRRHPRMRLFVDARDSLPVGERLLAATLAEGTANFGEDPTRSTASGPAMQSSRERYMRNATPERVRENFALFDALLFEESSFAIEVVQAEIARTRGNLQAAIEHYRKGVALEDALTYDEPPTWHLPVRQQLGAALLAAGDAAGAEAAFKQDLERHPQNHWALAGLAGVRGKAR